MIDLRGILCPTDFSESSKRALALAVELASLFDATVRVLHVLPDEPSHIALVHEPLAAPSPTRPPQVEKRAGDELRRFAETAEKARVAVETDLRTGDPVGTILEAATDMHTDLLVMGTHGHSGFERWVLGSVTEKVIRKAPCPVLTVRPDGTAPAPSRRVLCPTDLSESSRRALEWARVLAVRIGAPLEVLHAVEFFPEVPPLGLLGTSDEIVREGAEKELDAMLSGWAQEDDTPSEVTRSVVRGKAHREIVSVAEQHGVGLVVMGVHGHGVVDRMLFGSTTHHVVREAPCPVLIVRHPTSEP